MTNHPTSSPNIYAKKKSKRQKSKIKNNKNLNQHYKPTIFPSVTKQCRGQIMRQKTKSECFQPNPMEWVKKV